MNISKPKSQPKLLDQVRGVIRVKHYSIRTEQAYLGWIRRFILFHDKRHPGDMGKAEISAFLTHLAVSGNVAASTQNQALNAILFLYREVLMRDMGWLDEVERAKKPSRLPVVFTPNEARRVLALLPKDKWLIGQSSLWLRPAFDEVRSVARQGRRLLLSSDHGPGG